MSNRYTFSAAALLLSVACQHTSGPDRAPEAPDHPITVDTHIDVPYRLLEAWEDLGRDTAGDFDIPAARQGKLDAAFMSIFVPPAVDAAGDAHRFADDLIRLVERLASEHRDDLAMAHCADDVVRIRASGRIALPLGMENGGPIAGDLANLEYFYRRGIRYITLAHAKSNHISDSSYDSERRWDGLSPFGKELVLAMNDRGMMIDVSHLSDDAFWDVIATTNAPVIASHSSLRHFTPGFERNMSDEMVLALAAQGGVIQINAGSNFLSAQANAWSQRAREAAAAYAEAYQLAPEDPELEAFGKRYLADNPYPFATLDDLLDHIDRAVRIGGIDHVGIGSDFDGVGNTLPVGFKTAAAYPALIEGLEQRGYDTQAIGKILGGNLMRVWRQVETMGEQAGNPPICAKP